MAGFRKWLVLACLGLMATAAMAFNDWTEIQNGSKEFNDITDALLESAVNTEFSDCKRVGVFDLVAGGKRLNVHDGLKNAYIKFYRSSDGSQPLFYSKYSEYEATIPGEQAANILFTTDETRSHIHKIEATIYKLVQVNLGTIDQPIWTNQWVVDGSVTCHAR